MPDDAMDYGGGLGDSPNQTLDPLFRREANGVAIRAYRASWKIREPGGNPACAPPDTAQGELSNGAAVTMAMAPIFPTGAPPNPNLPVAVLTTGVFGESEGKPATWFIVEARSAKVRVSAGQSTDTMEPKAGIAILVLPGTNNPATIEAIDADGKVLGSQPADQMTEPRVMGDPACAPPPCSSPENPAGTTPVEAKPTQDPAAVTPAPRPADGDCVTCTVDPSGRPPTPQPAEAPPVIKPEDLGLHTGPDDGPCLVKAPVRRPPPTVLPDASRPSVPSTSTPAPSVTATAPGSTAPPSAAP